MKLVFLLLISGSIYCQKRDYIPLGDSIPFKIIAHSKIKGTDSTWYEIKNLETGEHVNTKCTCKNKIGDIRMVARKDIEYINPKKK